MFRRDLMSFVRFGSMYGRSIGRCRCLWIINENDDYRLRKTYNKLLAVANDVCRRVGRCTCFFRKDDDDDGWMEIWKEGQRELRSFANLGSYDCNDCHVHNLMTTMMMMMRRGITYGRQISFLLV